MSKSIKKTRIFIVEDNELTRQMVRAMLMKVRYFDVVGDAPSGELAVASVRLTRPELILADIGLPGIDGIEMVRQIRQNIPDIRAIMLTAHDNNDDLFKSFRAGAEGYILKSGLSAKRLELAIKTVEDGSVWLDPLIAVRVLSAALGSNGHQPVVHSAEPLSQEEKSILERVVETSAEIHHISPHCEYGVCNVEPSFLAKLRRFSSQEPPFRMISYSEVG